MKQENSTSGKVLRKIILAIVALLVLAGLAVLVAFSVTHTRLTRTYSLQVPPVVVKGDAATVERGRHLATTRGCTDCHGKDFAGSVVINDSMVGHLSGPNLTRGKGGLPADFGDLDYVRAIRHGIAPNGRPLLLMPSFEYTVLSDEDLGALIAFLKTVPAVDRPSGTVEPGPLMKVLIAVGEMKIDAARIDHDAKRPASVVAEPTAEYGRYLSASCSGCHGLNFAGGKIPGAPPDWPLAPNLTSATGTFMSQASAADFMHVLRTRTRPDGHALSPVMPAAFGQMTDLELTALYNYLKSVPAVVAKK
ncbi:MAG: cytochrome c [Opitutaceae bacterium]|nr:cytochrome c [Opitutaceae bacterium]